MYCFICWGRGGGTLPSSEESNFNKLSLHMGMYVVVQFYPWFKFSFVLLLGMVMYDNNMIMSLKQKKRTFEPRIKLNHNMYTVREGKTLIHLWIFKVSFQISVSSTFCHSGLASPFPELRKRVVFFSGTLSLRD